MNGPERCASRRFRCLIALLAIPVLSGVSSSAVFVNASPNATGSRFALSETWDVPSQTSDQLDRPVHLHAAFEQGELFVLERNGERVAAVSPSGSVLRRFGEGDLISATSSALVYPSTGSRGALLDAAASRLMVTDPSAGAVVLFERAGQFEGRSMAFERPVDIAHLRSDEAAFQAAVLDAGNGSIALVDLAGQIRKSIELAMVDPPILDATAIMADDIWKRAEELTVAVLDEGRAELVWLRMDGSRAAAADLSVIASSDGGLDGARLTPYPISLGNYRALVLSRSGLWLADASSFQVGATDRPISDPLDVVSLGAVDAVSIGRRDRLPSYQKAHLYVLSADGSGPSQVFLGHPPSGEHVLRPGCRPVAELRDDAWRIGVSRDGRTWVTAANGVVQQVGPDAASDATFSLGLVDDVEVSGELVLTAREQAAPVYRMTDSGVLTIDRGGPSRLSQPWYETVDCMESGFGVRASVSFDNRGITTTVGTMLVYETGERNVSFTQHWRRFLAGDLSRGVLSMYKDWRAGLQTPPAPRYMSDVAVSVGGEFSAAVERLEGAVYVYDIENQTTRKWSVPGRPHRLHWSPEGQLFVLSAEGYVFELGAEGDVIGSWDAAGAAPSARADLVDIAVDRQGRPLLLDRSGSVLVFDRVETGTGPAPPVELPPPCSLSTHSSAYPSRVARGEPITVTLRVGGSCLRDSAENDILVLLQPNPGDWGPQVFSSALADFIGLLDPSKDRLGLMVFDTTADLVVPLTEEFDEVANATSGVMARAGDYDGLQQPLDVAREYLSSSSREGVNRVVIAVTLGFFQRGDPMYGMVRAADELRQSGVRVIVISSRVRYSRVPSMLAFEPEDFYIAPDEATLRAVYQQLGQAFGARYLARDSRLVERPETVFDYEPDSASPSADWDPTERALTWQRPTIPFGGWEASYRTIATETGRWPVSKGAILEFVDGYGHGGKASYPIPWVDVYEPPTPTPTRRPPPTPTQTPTRTATVAPSPTVVPQLVYLPVALTESCDPTQVRIDVALVIDASSSMSDPASPSSAVTKLEAALQAVGSFLDILALDEGDQAAIVSFSSGAWLHVGLTAERATLAAALAKVETGQQTRLDRGIEVGTVALMNDATRNPNNEPVLVLLTDGRANPVPVGVAVERAEDAKAAGVTIFTIGLGEDLEVEALQRIASEPAFYLHAPTPSELEDVYADVARSIPCPASAYWGRR